MLKGQQKCNPRVCNASVWQCELLQDCAFMASVIVAISQTGIYHYAMRNKPNSNAVYDQVHKLETDGYYTSSGNLRYTLQLWRRDNAVCTG